MIEVERKYRVDNTSYIIKRLGELGYKKTESVHQYDIVFLQKSDSFKTFKVGDPVIRIRKANSLSTLTFKRAINNDGDTIEHEIKVEPTSEVEEFLLEIGFKPITKIEKVRTEFKLDPITISLDEVTNLGHFVEVEILCIEGEEEQAKENIAKVAGAIGLDPLRIEKKKYDQLISELPNIE